MVVMRMIWLALAAHRGRRLRGSTVTEGMEPLDDTVDHVRGGPAGRLIVEYGDYECPYSRRAFREIERVESQLGDRIRFAFRHFPLTEIHPHALAASAAAEAAGTAGPLLGDARAALPSPAGARGRRPASATRRSSGSTSSASTRTAQAPACSRAIRRDVESGIATGEILGTPTMFIDGVVHRGLLRRRLAAAGGHRPMTATCYAPRRDHAARAARDDRRLRGMPRERRHLGAPADVPELRADRVLRQLAQPARIAPRARDRARDRSLGRAGGGLELVLRRRGRVRDRGTLMLPELHLAEWRATKDTLHLYCQVRGQGPAGDDGAAQPLVERAALRRRPRPHHAPPASPRHDVRHHPRPRRPRARRPHRRRPQRGASRSHDGLDVAEFDRRLHAVARRARDRRRHPRGAVRRADDDAVPVRPRARRVGSRVRGALLGGARLDRPRARGVQRLVQRQDEPGPPVLAQPRPRRHALLRTRRPAGRGRPGHPGGLLERGDLVRVLGGRRQPRRRRLSTPTRRPSRTGYASSRWSAGEWRDTGTGSLAILPHEAVRTAADPRTTLLAFLQSAYEAGARTAGWDTSSFESTWCPTPGQLEELRPSAAAAFGRPTVAESTMRRTP